MQSRRVTGVVLIAGILAMIVGVAAHPHHGPVGTSTDRAWQNLVVAAIVVGSYGTLGVGFLRLLRSMPPQLGSDVASVALALAGVCGAMAAVAGHVVVPRVLSQVGGDQATHAFDNPVVVNDMIFSTTLAQTSMVAWSIGMLCLSITILQGPTGWKVVGAGGVLLGLGILAALAFGRLDLTLHNVGLVVLASGFWIGAIGLGLAANKSFAESSGMNSN